MTKRHQIEMDLVLILAAGAILGYVSALYYNNNSPKIRAFAIPAIENNQNQDQSTILNPAPTFAPKTETFMQISPDGSKKITALVTTNIDEAKTYVFTASD